MNRNLVKIEKTDSERNETSSRTVGKAQSPFRRVVGRSAPENHHFISELY